MVLSVSYEALLASVEHAIGGGSANLSMLLGVEVDFARPVVLGAPPAFEETGDTLVTVTVGFTEGITGTTTLVFTSEEARHMVEVMLTGMEYSDEDIFGELGISALGEAMNQFVAGIGRRLGEQKGYLVNISTPRVEIVPARDAAIADPPADVVIGLDGSIGPTPGRLYWAMTPEVLEALQPAGTDLADPASHAGADAAEAAGDNRTDEPHPSDPHPSDPHPGSSPLGRLADVMLDVTVELGRSRIPIRELLALDEGGVLRLGRPVGEPVDLLVNGLTTARGEIVVVDGRLGLRVTELIA